MQVFSLPFGVSNIHIHITQIARYPKLPVNNNKSSILWVFSPTCTILPATSNYGCCCCCFLFHLTGSPRKTSFYIMLLRSYCSHECVQIVFDQKILKNSSKSNKYICIYDGNGSNGNRICRTGFYTHTRIQWPQVLRNDKKKIKKKSGLPIEDRVRFFRHSLCLSVLCFRLIRM